MLAGNDAKDVTILQNGSAAYALSNEGRIAGRAEPVEVVVSSQPVYLHKSYVNFSDLFIYSDNLFIYIFIYFIYVFFIAFFIV